MGIVPSNCYNCEEECLDSVCCKSTGSCELYEKDNESFENDNSSGFRTVALSDSNFAHNLSLDSKQNRQCLNHLNDYASSKNQSASKCCCYHCIHGSSTSSCHSPRSLAPRQGHHPTSLPFYHNIYGDRNLAVEQRRAIIPPFPSVDALAFGLNNSKAAPNTLDNLSSVNRPKETKKEYANVRQNPKFCDSQKVLNNFQNFSRPQFNPDTESNSTSSGKY